GFYWEKSSHLGYREVMSKHTYSHRARSIEMAVGYEVKDIKPLVSIIRSTRRANMIGRIVEDISRQNYTNCELILVIQGFTAAQKYDLANKLQTRRSNIRRVEIIENNSEDTLGERFNKASELVQGEYIAKMDDDDFYFAN